MGLLDDDHRVAAHIRDLHERISDLEETSRERVTPNLLITLRDRITVSDRVSVDVVDARAATFTWDEGQADGAGGWDRGGWE